MRKKKKFNISLLAYVLCAIMIIIIIPCVSDISGDVFRSKGRMSGYEEDSLYNDFIENNYEGLLEKTEYNTGIGKDIDKDTQDYYTFAIAYKKAVDYRVYVNNGENEKAEQVVKDIDNAQFNNVLFKEALENVKNITSSEDTINKLINIANGVRIASAVILILLVLISVFIITNTIKLTVHARRKEISIMKYVGATNGFIRWPFIVEGITIGVIAGMISLLIIGGLYNLLTDRVLETSLQNIIDVSLLSFNEMFSLILIVYLILGVGIGIVGSSISMRKYLEV